VLRAAKAGADSGAASRANPEVVAKDKRRTYTAEDKRRILEFTGLLGYIRAL
jgi:hypothetical protein